MLDRSFISGLFTQGGKKEKLFNFFWLVAFRDYFKLSRNNKNVLLDSLDALGRKLEGRDFVSPSGVLFGYYKFFQYGDESQLLLRMEQRPVRRLAPWKKIMLVWQGRVYGTCSSLSLWRKLFNRLVFPVPDDLHSPYVVDNVEFSRIVDFLAKTQLSDIDKRLFVALLPVEFYAVPVQVKGLSQVSEFHGNAYELVANPFLALADNGRIRLVGYQHGGVYGEWADNELEQAEIAIYDEYWAWLKKGVTRFNRFMISMPCFLSMPIRRVVWVGRPLLRSDISGSPSYLRHVNDMTSVFAISDAVPKINVPVKLKLHPRSSPREYLNVISSGVELEKRSLESFLGQRDLVLFDCHSHTLIYFCLKYKLPFALVLSGDELGLTPEYVSVINVLKGMGVVITSGKGGEALAAEINTVLECWHSISDNAFYRKLIRLISNG